MEMSNISGNQGTSSMQHSEAMHKSHHNNSQTNVESPAVTKVDRFEKSDDHQHFKTYNAQGQIEQK